MPGSTFQPSAFELKQPSLILSVDVESWEEANIDYHFPSNFVVMRQTEKVLKLLGQFNAKATFFILGKVAETFPALVKYVVSAGHEIACHSFFHLPVYRQKPIEFKADLLRAKEILESLSGQKVVGFRAPYFSITKDALWALPILTEAGFAYDSSLVPARGRSYGFESGFPDAQRLIFSDNSSLIEFPPTPVKVFGVKVPLGGGYFRIFSKTSFINALSEAQRKKRPAVFYFHPHELETLPPRSELKNVPLWIYWKENMGRRKFPEKLEFLLSRLRFTTFREALGL